MSPLSQDLFAAPAPRVFTIPPSADFLGAIASTLSSALRLKDDPAALSGAQIFTPNRRAARTLAEAFHGEVQKLGRTALISPEIRVLGDLEDDDTIAPIGVSELDLGPPLSKDKRRGALANLVQKWRRAAYGETLPPASALAAADELSSLLDQAAMGENVEWSRLDDLVADADLAQHWQLSTRFLAIVAEQWPEHLREQGATDPMARRLAAAEALANAWQAAPPDYPVIVAGSTGATPATRILMQAAMNLPRGAIILPGLDPDVGEKAWRAIPDSPSHPQHTLNRALQKIDVDREQVTVWPGVSETLNAQARRKLINEALAPASTTRAWTDRLKELANDRPPQELIENGLDGLTLIVAEDETEEALSAALMLREVLETPGKTAALITPDPSLARRVSALLKRWDVDIAPSAGHPFLQTPHGSLFGLVFEWLSDPAAPVELLAVLKHPLVRLGLSSEAYATAIRQLEVHALEFRGEGVMRGPRRHQTLRDLAARFSDQKRFEAAGLITKVADALDASNAVQATHEIDGKEAAQSVARLIEILTTTDEEPGDRRFWRGRAGAMSARYLESLAELSSEMGPLPRDLWPDFASAAARSLALPPAKGEHPRLAIWGPLEARLQSRDLVIVGGLNEGVWPAPAPADSFLSRRLRKDLGLPDPEERLGLSAHDFSQFACAKDVVLLRSERRDDKPAVASRWLWRLRTLASGGLSGLDEADRLLAPPEDANPLHSARAMRTSNTFEPRAPSRPTPPVDARPTKFSVSRVGKLLRDPYAVYAEDILGLKPLPPVDETVGPAGKGTAIHEAVDRVETQGGDIFALITEELIKAGETQASMTLSAPLWQRAANAFLNWRESRKDKVAHTWTEIWGETTETINGQAVRLYAKADRVEQLKDNSYAIVDFKTGQPKQPKQVESGLEPQLPLEGYLASLGAFKDKDGDPLPKGPTSEFIYVSLSPGANAAKADNGRPLKLDSSEMEVVENAVKGFRQLITNYQNPDQPYLSKPRVQFTWNVSDYDRLARRAEWTSDDGEA